MGDGSPTDFINGITKIFFGVTCDHSFGGSQEFTMFTMSLLIKRVLPRVPESPNLPKMDIVSPWFFAKPEKKEIK